jgi:hypothetical protein
MAALLLISTSHRGLLDWFSRTVAPEPQPQAKPKANGAARRGRKANGGGRKPGVSDAYLERRRSRRDADDSALLAAEGFARRDYRGLERGDSQVANVNHRRPQAFARSEPGVERGRGLGLGRAGSAACAALGRAGERCGPPRARGRLIAILQSVARREGEELRAVSPTPQPHPAGRRAAPMAYGRRQARRGGGRGRAPARGGQAHRTRGRPTAFEQGQYLGDGLIRETTRNRRAHVVHYAGPSYTSG